MQGDEVMSDIIFSTGKHPGDPKFRCLLLFRHRIRPLGQTAFRIENQKGL